MTNEGQALWYVVHTYSGYENKVAENIERLVEYRGLQNLIFETRIPTEIVVDSQEEADEYFDSLEVEYDDDGNEIKRKYSARSNMSTGQINKLKANYTHEKVYSKKLAFDIISRFSSAGDFKAKTREAIAESLWEGLNGCTGIEERNTFAHDTAVFVVGKMLSESRANNPEAEAAREKLAYLRSGIQRITFSESDIEEIKHLRDVAGHRSIQSRWGYKKNSSGKTKLKFLLKKGQRHHRDAVPFIIHILFE